MRITKGDLVLLSAEEYSDYSILDTFRAKKDFDTNEVMREFLLGCPEYDEEMGHRPEYEELQKWAIANGFVEELITIEWHIGSYGRFDFD